MLKRLGNLEEDEVCHGISFSSANRRVGDATTLRGHLRNPKLKVKAAKTAFGDLKDEQKSAVRNGRCKLTDCEIDR